jgi:hypothetical protein
VEDDGRDVDATMSHHKRRRQRPSLRPLIAIGVLLGGLVLASAFAGVTIQENALAREISALNAQISVEQGKQASLERSAAEKKTSDYVVDKAKDLGFVWPWEALIAVQREADKRAQLPESVRAPRIARWIALFVGTR